MPSFALLVTESQLGKNALCASVFRCFFRVFVDHNVNLFDFELGFRAVGVNYSGKDVEEI